MSYDENLTATLKSIDEGQQKLVAALDNFSKSAAETPARQTPFNVRRGEDSLSSRGYSYLKLFGLMSKQLDPEHARLEHETANRLQKMYVDVLGYSKATTNSILAPFAADYLAEIPGQEGFAKELREVVSRGVSGFDVDEVRAISNKLGVRTKALSWIDETAGGALVAPPLHGELIELLRNNEVLMQAGARSIAMPPNGRIIFPRQTAAGSAYWVGQSTQITDSDVQTGDVTLQAKKLGILMKVPNELFRFSSVSVEMFLREDIARVMALKLDKTLLEGTGSSHEPKGLINYSQITSHTASTTGSNGNTFTPEDVSLMIGKVEEQNAIFKSFVMRPLMYTALANRRADAITANDAKGQFLFNMWRELSGAPDLDFTRTRPGNLYGYPVFKSTQIANDRVKGSGTNLSYILGGDFTDYMIAMSGAVEFMISTQGDSPFTQDQTWYRGILYCDGAPRREASFILCDQLLVA